MFWLVNLLVSDSICACQYFCEIFYTSILETVEVVYGFILKGKKLSFSLVSMMLLILLIFINTRVRKRKGDEEERVKK